MIVFKEVYPKMDIGFFRKYGESLLKSVGYSECKRTYGPLFIKWYNTEYKMEMEECV